MITLGNSVFLSVLLCFKFSTSQLLTKKDKQEAKREGIFMPGDIILGGLFMLHETCDIKAEYDRCNSAFSRPAFQEMLAMLLAVRDVNRNEKLLPGVTIGAHITNTCGEVNTAVREVLNFSFVRGHIRKHTSCKNNTRTSLATISNASHFENETVAIIGPSLSETARAVADLAGLFHIPVVSQSATSVTLGDRKRFGHFFRTVPPDNYQAKVMIDMMLQFGWNFFILLTGDDEYGRSGRRALRSEIAQYSLCIEMDEVVTAQNLPEIVSKIKKKAKARIIVSFLKVDYLIRTLNESKAKSLSDFTWLLSDSWTSAHLTTRHKDLVLEPMLGAGPMQFEDEWFRHELIKATNGTSLPWAKSFNCFEESFCERQKLSECVVGRHYEVSPFVAPTFDAVYAVASALHEQLRCSEQYCHVSRSRNGDLVDYLRHITFTGISGRNISFDGEGTASRSYQVVSFQRTTSGLNLVRIANWTPHPTGNLSTGRFHWITQVKWDSVVAPGSNCSRNCAPGEYKTPQKLHPNCCWNCVKCGGGTITKYMNAKKCSICPRGFSPNDNRTDCIPIHDVFIEWNGGISIAIVTLSSICIAVVILTYVVFAFFKDTPIVKAARHSLCYMQLLGVICFEILPFVFIGKPRAINCDLKPFLIGFCLSFNIGTIFVKTNKTARSFNEKAFETNRSILKRQIVIVLLIIALEELICLVWILTMDRPHLKKIMLSPRESCQACMYGNSSKGVALWCSYNAGLVLVTTYQAILVRKAKCNFNESKFLLFTMVSWCVTILVYIPVFVGINGYIKDIIMSFLLIFMGMIEYICIFVPKLYIIFFRPHKNISK